MHAHAFERPAKLLRDDGLLSYEAFRQAGFSASLAQWSCAPLNAAAKGYGLSLDHAPVCCADPAQIWLSYTSTKAPYMRSFYWSHGAAHVLRRLRHACCKASFHLQPRLILPRWKRITRASSCRAAVRATLHSRELATAVSQPATTFRNSNIASATSDASLLVVRASVQ